MYFVSVGAVVIEGPSEVIYRPGDYPIELTCNNIDGLTGWQVNGGDILTIPEIGDDGELPGHTVNGTNLVVVNASNNTEYVCFSLTNTANTPSAPVYLYIAGMLIISLHA